MAPDTDESYQYKLLIASGDSKNPVQTTYYATVSRESILKELQRKQLPLDVPLRAIGEAIARAKCAEIFRTQTGVQSWKFTANPFAMPATAALRFEGSGIIIREEISAL
ncbi:MAG: hypothetical protein QM760_10305 [Nibricoccus sp.]